MQRANLSTKATEQSCLIPSAFAFSLLWRPLTKHCTFSTRYALDHGELFEAHFARVCDITTRIKLVRMFDALSAFTILCWPGKAVSQRAESSPLAVARYLGRVSQARYGGRTSTNGADVDLCRKLLQRRSSAVQ